MGLEAVVPFLTKEELLPHKTASAAEASSGEQFMSLLSLIERHAITVVVTHVGA